MLIQASIAAGVRPTTMILGEDNRKAWSEMDVLIMQAWQILETERCPDCGSYVWLCANDDPRLNVKIKKVEDCLASREVKDYNERHKDDDVRGRPVFYDRDEELPLHAFRARYYDQLQADGDEGDED